MLFCAETKLGEILSKCIDGANAVVSAIELMTFRLL